MSQSGYIAAALLAGFILYLAAQNRLIIYASVLWGPAPPAPSGSAGSSSSSGSGGSGGLSIGTIAEVAAVAA